ncbi:hypothetical protein [Spirosoma endbachense]|uniref:Uncharacterized protein n=1 Tax=Spirosoma endbachense TaxID=2666025 RepID=A0A6P1W8P9_9BACT|nr:hypothetical protein [Spirosoma endbachense]QHW00939.1 hypothetical protein GJR95_40515 [Spirosoma endbachense]
MTIIFNYLFTKSDDGFVCRVPVRILNKEVINKGVRLNSINSEGVDIQQWVGKNLDVTIQDGIYSITGLAG